MVNRRVAVQIDADISGFNRGVLSGAASTRKWVNELEAADGRMAMLVQTGMALAPALVPIGAAAVPAIAGLTTQLGFAAVAGGTALLAFQGVGDALGALNKAQIEPTAENMKKLNQTMDALGPAGVVFVHELQEMRDEWQGLQDVAQQEMFPGMTEGIESLMTQMPAFERVIASVASTIGDLSAEAGAGLASEEWVEFYDYLEREAGPILEAMGHTLGNFVEGMTNMVMAFDPLSDSFAAGMLEMSESFVAWSDGLDSSESFQEFVRYIQESGPQAMDTLGAIAGALIEFVEAAAPVGAVVLPVLEVLADALAGIADSPAGPVIIGAAAAIGTLGRSLALLSAVGLRGGGDSMIGKALGVDVMKSYPAAVRGVTDANNSLISAQAALATQATKTRDAQFAMTPTADKRKAVQQYAKAQDEVRSATLAVADAEKQRAGAMRESAKQFGRASLAVGGLAAMSTGAADSIGLTNTVSLGLMGTLAGPMGAAVGAGVGALLDLKGAADTANASIENLSKPKSVQDLFGLDDQINAAKKSVEDLATDDGFLQFGDYFSDVGALLSSSVAEREAKIAEIAEQGVRIRDAFAVVGESMGEDFTDGLGRNMVPTLEQLATIADRAAPAMQALGISAEDLADMDAGELEDAAGAIARWTTYADSAAGRTKAVADAMRELDNGMTETATAADILKNSLDALLDPGMNLSAATDAWRDGLRNLNKELDENNGSLFANTDAASQNRSVIRDRVSGLKDLLVAEANAGASAGDLSKMLRNQREALLKAGEAAGIARPQLKNYLDDLGLTPKMVKTVMKLEAKEAEDKAENIRGRLERLGQMKPTPQVQAKIDAALAQLAAVEARLAELNGKTATTYVRTVNTSGFGPQAESAFGNIFPSVRAFAYGDIANGHQAEIAGPGMTRVWREPETQGEAYIPLANDGRRPRARNILEETASLLGARSVEWFADGGTKGGKDWTRNGMQAVAIGGEVASKDGIRQLIRQLGGLEKALERHEKSSERQTKAIDKQTAAADAAKGEVDRIVGLAASLASATTSGFRTDLFQTQTEDIPGDPIWRAGAQGPRSVTTGGWMENLTADIAGLQERASLQEQLVAAGLDGAAFEQALSQGTNADLSALLAGGDIAVQGYEAMFAQREALLASTGAAAGNLRYGGEINNANAVWEMEKRELELQRLELKDIKLELKLLNREQNQREARREAREERNAERTGEVVGAAVNGAASAGQRDRANRPNRQNGGNR